MSSSSTLPVVLEPAVSLIRAPVRASKKALFCTRRLGASERALLFWSVA